MLSPPQASEVRQKNSALKEGGASSPLDISFFQPDSFPNHVRPSLDIQSGGSNAVAQRGLGEILLTNLVLGTTCLLIWRMQSSVLKFSLDIVLLSNAFICWVSKTTALLHNEMHACTVNSTLQIPPICYLYCYRNSDISWFYVVTIAIKPGLGCVIVNPTHAASSQLRLSLYRLLWISIFAH